MYRNGSKRSDCLDFVPFVTCIGRIDSVDEDSLTQDKNAVESVLEDKRNNKRRFEGFDYVQILAVRNIFPEF